VVLGNPPYNGYAGMAVDEERELSEAYRTTKRAPKPQGQGLNDLYVRFYRIAERQITERTGRGVGLLDHQQQLDRQPLVHWNARTVLGGVRPHPRRQPER